MRATTRVRRRLVERGVRFIMIHSGQWDLHSEIKTKHAEKCRATDQPLAALLTDLKRRGSLDETLVAWGGEFGRAPAAQGEGAKVGRDRSPSGYSMWLAGGGVQGGQVIGVTDPVSYSTIERPIHPNDLHATLLHTMGIDQHQHYERHNRREIVTVNGGEVVDEVFRQGRPDSAKRRLWGCGNRSNPGLDGHSRIVRAQCSRSV